MIYALYYNLSRRCLRETLTEDIIATNPSETLQGFRGPITKTSIKKI